MAERKTTRTGAESATSTKDRWYDLHRDDYSTLVRRQAGDAMVPADDRRRGSIPKYQYWCPGYTIGESFGASIPAKFGVDLNTNPGNRHRGIPRLAGGRKAEHINRHLLL